VSCTSASACIAVGDSFNTAGNVVTLAERWDGSSWSVQSTPSPGGTYSFLNGVSCTSASSCTATGLAYIGATKFTVGTQVTLAEFWNGTSWSVQPTPTITNPSGKVTASELAGVSCTSAAACTAVGYYQIQGTGEDFALAEAWNGSSWSVQSTPSLQNGGLDPALDRVSCTSAAACTAVGTQEIVADVFGDVSHLTLAEAWNGSAWAVQSTPNP
jgi:hypothetical protein